MTWRGTASWPDRLLASLPYLLPLVDGYSFGSFLFRDFPILQVVFQPLYPLIWLNRSFWFVGIAVFFLLLFLVVRNTNINHFIRFNTMQAILLDIVLIIVQVILQLLAPAVQGGLVLETIMNAVFLAMIAAVSFSVVQTLRGQYAEIPTISNAVHMQVR